MKAARIFIVEDHAVMIEAYRAILETEADLEVCGTAQTALEALDAMPAALPDLVLVDVSLPGLNGIELVERLRTSQPETKALVISGHHEAIYAERALSAGASGFLDKRGLGDALLKAIRSVLNGEVYVSDAVRARG